jgi:hypothetical protein
MSDQWGRPPQQPNQGPSQPTEPRGRSLDPATQKIPRDVRPSQPPQYPPQQPYGQQPYPQQQPPSYPQQPQPYPQQGGYQPPPQQPPAAPVGDVPPPPKKKRGLKIGLALVVVLALLIAGVVGVELYARNEGNSKIATAAACIVEDGATASFGAFPPFLWQYMNDDYSSISIATAGNNIRQAKGMKAEVEIQDLKLADSGDSKGTIGSLNATITWTGDGISKTIEEFIPVIGSVVSDVKLNSSNGTVEVGGGLAGVTIKPITRDNGIALEIEDLTGLGFALPKDDIQKELDSFTDDLNKNYPLDIKADSIEVTDAGIVAKFSTTNATIKNDGGSSNECLNDL